MPRAVLRLSLLVLLLAPAGGHASPGAPAPVLQVPGGVAGLARALNLPADVPRSRLLLTAIRVMWEKPEGADAESDRRRARGFEYLRGAGAAVPASAAGPADLVPGFLPAEAWASVLGDLAPATRDMASEPASTFAAILGNRRASFLYHGIASLDQPTRAFFLEHPALLRQLSEADRVAVFATFVRSLRVRRGEIALPGGPEAAPLWQEVVGERATDPAAFILRVLTRDAGRLALFYDGIAHLPAGAQRFALGLDLPPEKRAARFRAFYEAAGAGLKNWLPQQRPFAREPFDAVHLLFSMTFGPRGEVAGPTWPGFWKAAFAPVLPEKWPAPGDLDDDARLDAAQLLALFTVAHPAERARRTETWLFAHRVFPRPPREAVRDLLVTVRGFAAYPTLLLTLERMGIQDPATYAEAVRAAARLADADRRLWQFQAALAILERARVAHSLDRQAAESLVHKLCAITPDGSEPYRGAVARWIERDFLAAVGEAVVPPELPVAVGPLETRLLAAMAGSVSSPSNRRLLALPPLEWEGLSYRIDPGQSTLRRLVQVRERQGGPSLDAVLAFARVADAVAGARSSAAVLEEVSKLEEAVLPLEQPIAAAGGRGTRDPRALTALAGRALERARRLSETPDRQALAGIAQPLQEAGDEYLADVIGSIAYAPHLGEADSPALLAGDPSRMHDFRRVVGQMEAGRRGAWQLPLEFRDPDAGWHVTGSLLCLDLAVGGLSLPRVPAETMPEAPNLFDVDRQTFTDSALALSAFDLTEQTRASLLAAVDRGRSRVMALESSSAEVERVAADAELDEWRAQALPWTLAHEPDRRLASFSLAELARAGGLDPADLDGLHSWGLSGLARGQTLAPTFPVRLPWTTIAGRHGVRSGVAALVPDLVIGLAESSARMNLPAPLTAGLVLVATQEFIDTAHVAHADDWLAMVACAQSVARNRLEDYVAALTVAGPLVPEVR